MSFQDFSFIDIMLADKPNEDIGSDWESVFHNLKRSRIIRRRPGKLVMRGTMKTHRRHPIGRKVMMTNVRGEVHRERALRALKSIEWNKSMRQLAEFSNNSTILELASIRSDLVLGFFSGENK